MKKATLNRFLDGLIADASAMASPQRSLKQAQNIDLLSKDGEPLSLQKRESNREHYWTNPKDVSEVIKTSMTAGFEPIALKEQGGIAYIISYNKTTGESEIGTYPSPDYRAFRITEGAPIACETSIDKTVDTTEYTFYTKPTEYTNIETVDVGDTLSFNFALYDVNMPNAEYTITPGDPIASSDPGTLNLTSGQNDIFTIDIDTSAAVTNKTIQVQVTGVNTDPSPTFSVTKYVTIGPFTIVEPVSGITTKNFYTAAQGTNSNISCIDGAQPEVVEDNPIISLEIAGTGIYPLDVKVVATYSYDAGSPIKIDWPSVSIFQGDANTAGATILGNVITLNSDGTVRIVLDDLLAYYTILLRDGYSSFSADISVEIVSTGEKFVFEGDVTLAGDCLKPVATIDLFTNDYDISQPAPQGVWYWE